MKETTLLLFLLFSLSTVNAQNRTTSENSNWSTSFDIGLASANGGFTDGYTASNLNNFSVSLGGRYMFNSDSRLKPFGIQFKGGFSNLLSNASSQDFETRYYFANLNGVVNIKDTFAIPSTKWIKDFSLYTGLGIGMGHYKFDDLAVFSEAHNSFIIGGDKLFTINFSLTPEYNLSENVSVHLELNYNLLAGSNFTIDGNRIANDPDVNISAFDPSIFKSSIGITYYITPES